MKVLWTYTAIEQLNSNILYLKENWDAKVLDDFLEELDKTVDYISKCLISGMYDESTEFHKYLVVRQIYLFYKIENNILYIEYLWNNYQKPLG